MVGLFPLFLCRWRQPLAAEWHEQQIGRKGDEFIRHWSLRATRFPLLDHHEVAAGKLWASSRPVLEKTTNQKASERAPTEVVCPLARQNGSPSRTRTYSLVVNSPNFRPYRLLLRFPPNCYKTIPDMILNNY